MQIRITRREVPKPKVVSIEDFADQHGLVMDLREYDYGWAASFEGAEVMRNGCLVGEYGVGKDQRLAIADYARKLSGKRIAIDAFTPLRREIDVPTLECVWVDHQLTFRLCGRM